MRLTNSEILLFEELLEEFFNLHPQLNDVEFDDSGRPYEYKDGYISYDSYGPNKIKELNQLASKLKSLI